MKPYGHLYQICDAPCKKGANGWIFQKLVFDGKLLSNMFSFWKCKKFPDISIFSGHMGYLKI